MKNRTLRQWSLGLLLGALTATGGCSRAASSPPSEAGIAPEALIASSASEITPELALESDASAAPAPEVVLPETAAPAGTNLADAPVQPISTEKVVPPNVRASGPFAEIVKLADSGVDESVLLAFVTNSSSTFNASADEIIYLNDLGVPATVVTAMMAHDQVLKGGPGDSTALSASVSTPAPGQYAPGPEPPATAPAEMASTEPPPEPIPTPPAAAPEAGFYDALSPYGSWVNVEGYGPCWQPTVVMVNPGWQPYFDGGRWVYTDCGWYWLSDYSWGWAPFHYGRWFRHHHYGWCWAPDNVWGPSWVSWRYTVGYCGWAPLPPGAWYRPGIGLTYWGRGVGVSFDFGLGADCFSFIAWGHFHDHHFQHYAVSHDHLNRVFHESTVVTRISGDRNHIANHGLTVEHVTAATHLPVHQVALRESAPAANGVRAERLSGDGRTLTAARLPSRGGAMAPAPARGRAQAGGANSLASPAATPNRRLTTEAAPNQVLMPSRTSVRADTPRDAPRIFRNEPTAPGRPSASSERNPGAFSPASPSPRTPPAVPSSRALRQPEPAAPTGTQPFAPPARGTTPRFGSNPNSQPAQPPSAWSAPRASEPPGRTERSAPTPRVQAPSTPSAFNNRPSVPTPAPVPRYEPPVRSAPVEVPRFNPAPVERPRFDSGAGSAPARSFSAPPPSAPAPSAPPAASSHSQSSPDRSDHSDHSSKGGR